MNLGGDEHKEKAVGDFKSTFSRMTDLLRDARSVEFQLKIVFDVSEHIDHLKGREYEIFAKSTFTAARPKIDRLIRTMADPADVAQLQAIRLLAEPLAHADYEEARRKIDEYASTYPLDKVVSSEKLGERFVENITDEDGNKANYARLIDWSRQNTIIENFLLFEHQGYAAAAQVAFEIAKSKFNLDKIGWLYEILMISKAIKPENKIQS